MEPTIGTTMRLTLEEKRKLEELARSETRSVSSYLRVLIAREYEKMKKGGKNYVD